MDLPSLSSRLSQKVMRHSASHAVRDAAAPTSTSTPAFRSPGICVPQPLSDSEVLDIQRCFQRANAKVEGYLDCGELKEFMELRRCPITHWEAEQLLHHADATYHYYITLEQITNLATHFGIGTQTPLRLTLSEFEVAIERSFGGGGGGGGSGGGDPQLTSTSTPLSRRHSAQGFDFDGVVNYFESRVAWTGNVENEDDSEDDSVDADEDEPRHHHHQVRARASISRKFREIGINTSPPRNVGARPQTPLSPLDIINSAFPTKTKATNSEDEVCVDDEPLLPVHAIKKKWEQKIRDLIANNGDDFLVKLEKQRKSVDAVKVVRPRPTPHHHGAHSNSVRFVQQPKLVEGGVGGRKRSPPVVKSIFKRNPTQQGDRESRNQIGKVKANLVTDHPPELPPPMVPKLPRGLRRRK